MFRPSLPSKILRTTFENLEWLSKNSPGTIYVVQRLFWYFEQPMSLFSGSMGRFIHQCRVPFFRFQLIKAIRVRDAPRVYSNDSMSKGAAISMLFYRCSPMKLCPFNFLLPPLLPPNLPLSLRSRLLFTSNYTTLAVLTSITVTCSLKNSKSSMFVRRDDRRGKFGPEEG